MKSFETADGSITYINEETQDYYHSKTGAREEAFEKYAKPSMVEKFDNVKILDVCFGLGYNSAAAIDQFKGETISITALELDEKIVDEMRNIDAPFLCWDIMKELSKYKQYEDSKHKLELIMGDFKEEVKKLIERGEKYDLIYFDAFSPNKVKDQWSEEVFSNLHKLMKTTGILLTYSCATWVRANLRAAGFKVTNGPSIGRRAPSTIAFA